VTPPGSGEAGAEAGGKRPGLLSGTPVPGSASLGPSPRPRQQPACPAAAPEKPININVLLESTSPTKGPEVFVALPSAELRPSNQSVPPEGLYFGFPHPNKSLAAARCPFGALATSWLCPDQTDVSLLLLFPQGVEASYFCSWDMFSLTQEPGKCHS